MQFETPTNCGDSVKADAVELNKLARGQAVDNKGITPEVNKLGRGQAVNKKDPTKEAPSAPPLTRLGPSWKN
jgi:hypothetical protein